MNSKKNVGLALGGGVILGASHIGTLRALEENGIEISYVAGTSIGAFVGALFAFGKNWKEIKAITSEIKWLDITEIQLSKFALLSNRKLGQLITDHIGDQKIEDASIPLAIVTTNIASGEKVVLKKGSVAQAVMASTCLRGIFDPVEIDSKLLVDGGIVENIPVKTLKEMGADFLIGADLTARKKLEQPGSILDVIINALHFLIKQSGQIQIEDPHILIQPELSSFSLIDMSQIDDIMEQGYQDSMKALSEIKA